MEQGLFGPPEKCTTFRFLSACSPERWLLVRRTGAGGGEVKHESSGLSEHDVARLCTKRELAAYLIN
jgi:hypothetical protein